MKTSASNDSETVVTLQTTENSMAPRIPEKIIELHAYVLKRIFHVSLSVKYMVIQSKTVKTKGKTKTMDNLFRFAIIGGRSISCVTETY